jgi:hypothetical protein
LLSSGVKFGHTGFQDDKAVDIIDVQTLLDASVDVIHLKKSSGSGESVAVEKASLAAIAISSCVASVAPNQSDVGEPSGVSKKKSKRPSKLSLTVVVSSASSQRSIRALTVAVSRTGCSVKNVFGRGIATVAGLLARSTETTSATAVNPFLATLLKSPTPVVLHLQLSSGSDEILLDASLVRYDYLLWSDNAAITFTISVLFFFLSTFKFLTGAKQALRTLLDPISFLR